MSKSMPGYKQTEVGVIPEDWTVETLTRCVRPDAPICYGILMPGQFYAGGIPVIKVKDIMRGRVNETDLLLTHPTIDDAYRRSRLQTGDVLITIRGTTGRVAIVPNTLSGANITQDTARARINRNYSSRFLYIAIQSQAVQNQIALQTIGQAVKGINIRDVKNLAIPLPTAKAEQDAIAEALSDADALIESLEQLVAKKRHVKQGAMQDLLAGKKRLPGFGGKWMASSLREGVLVLSGHHVLAQHCNTEGFGFPYITGPSDFPDGVIGITKFTLRPTTVCSISDILITVKGSGVGSMVVSDGSYCISRQLMAIRVGGVWDTKFVYFLLLQDSALIGAAATGLIPGISRGDLLNKQVLLPPLPEQTAIAAILSDMDAEIAALETKLAKARQIKQGMMQDLLTGRIRLV